MLCTFDNSPVKFFASVSHDSRIKIWDALSGVLLNEYTEEQHLAAQYTRVAFIRAVVKVCGTQNTVGWTFSLLALSLFTFFLFARRRKSLKLR